jgi:hypothetical protein
VISPSPHHCSPLEPWLDTPGLCPTYPILLGGRNATSMAPGNSVYERKGERQKKCKCNEAFRHSRDLFTKSARGGAKSAEMSRNSTWESGSSILAQPMMALARVHSPCTTGAKGSKWFFVQFKRSLVLTHASPTLNSSSCSVSLFVSVRIDLSL